MIYKMVLENKIIEKTYEIEKYCWGIYKWEVPGSGSICRYAGSKDLNICEYNKNNECFNYDFKKAKWKI